MSYLHSHDIIHRDLKPDNILMDQFYLPKIADFGLSKVNNSNSKSMSYKSTNGIKGTPLYMSPEIWEKAEYTKACDVYAFAFIVYEIITNLKPFSNLNFFQIPLQVHQGYRPEFKFEIPKAYRNLIEKCWSQKTFNRPSFDEIIDELKNNKGFITEKVNEEDYLNFIKYINDSKISFDSDKKISLNEYLNIKSSTFNSIDKEFKIIQELDSMPAIFSFNLFSSLDAKCKSIIKESIDDQNKEFELAQFLIEGQYNFPQNVQLGIEYLKISFEKGSNDAFIYYCKMLIKGKIIPKNHKKVLKLINERYKQQDPVFLFLYGKILKQQMKYKESISYFEKAVEEGDVESLYELGKVYYKGLGTNVDKEKSFQYFQCAIENKNIKAMYYYGSGIGKY